MVVWKPSAIWSVSGKLLTNAFSGSVVMITVRYCIEGREFNVL